jgi:hypothetical protein
MNPPGLRFAILSAGAFVALYGWNVGKADPTTTAVPSTLERRVGSFVRAITQNPGMSDDDPLVRWNTPICLLIAGLAAEDVKALSDRLSQTASSAGAPLERGPCHPNFVIVATSEPDTVLNAWYKRDSRLFGDATPVQIRQFIESSQSKPVRIWHNIDAGRKSGVRNGHFIPSNTRAESSAFTGNTAYDFHSVFAIVDIRRTGHTTLNQWADYVAMAGLTNVDLDADLGGAPTILQLFAASAENGSGGLSSWDVAFLKALYQSNQTSKTQRLEIAQRTIQGLSQ